MMDNSQSIEDLFNNGNNWLTNILISVPMLVNTIIVVFLIQIVYRISLLAVNIVSWLLAIFRPMNYELVS